MGYYYIPLDEETKKLCTPILPWGKYNYKQLPTGVASAPDIFQEIMNNLFGDLDFVLVYIDDILITERRQDRRQSPSQNRANLKKTRRGWGFCANLNKFFFMQK